MSSKELFAQSNYLFRKSKATSIKISRLLVTDDLLETKSEQSLEKNPLILKKIKFYEGIVLFFDVPPNEELVDQLKKGNIFEKKSEALNFLYLQYKHLLNKEDDIIDKETFYKNVEDNYFGTRNYIFFLKTIKINSSE